ncbi:glycosyltransferase [uncultured Methanobrevibacter sp.]|uniref:glycosyltransferase n=1 Tax=uncultured Methanobrevibacter sp. TaxID=253161 RepID=UPI0025FA4F37|nr:glycosyltransferase [uncultured Methanobrevibacter sp.]
MKYKISVIIPIYNAEKHLNNTIQSIIKQSIGFENIELILVDDASKDNSRKIIESYDEKYDNIITYYSEKNHGYPGFGRNIGLKKATSKYIMFIDNDDEYDKDICKTLYETIINEDADIAVCGRMYVDEVSSVKEEIPLIKGIEKNDKIILKNDELLYFNSHIVLNKIFKNEIISLNNLKFPEDSRLDDRIFTFDYYINSEKLVYLKNYYGYYWNIHSTSLSHTGIIKYINEIIDATLYELNELKKLNKEQHISFRPRNTVIHLILQASYLELNNDEFKDILKKIHNFEKEINFNENLNNMWFEPINKLILHEHYTTAIILLKCLNTIRKSTILKKIYRTINNTD